MLTTTHASISCCPFLFSLPLTHRLCLPFKNISVLFRLLFALSLLPELSTPLSNRDLGTFLFGEKFRLKQLSKTLSKHSRQHTFAAASFSAFCFCNNVSIERGSALGLAAMARDKHYPIRKVLYTDPRDRQTLLVV